MPAYKDVITPPKTPKSNRIIAMPEFLLTDLKDYLSSMYCVEPDDRLFPCTKHFFEREMQRGVKLSGVKRNEWMVQGILTVLYYSKWAYRP